MKTKNILDSLENIVEDVKDKWLETTVKLSENPGYKFGVDVISGWAYYTPTYAIQEIIAGKDFDSILTTRAIGLLAHMAAMRPIGKLRNYYAKKWGVTKESPLIDQYKVSLAAVTPVQSVVYAGMLIGGMAWSGNWDWTSSAYAYAIGVGLGALHSIPFGMVQDKVREFFGVKPAIANKQETKYITDKNTPSNYTSC